MSDLSSPLPTIEVKPGSGGLLRGSGLDEEAAAMASEWHLGSPVRWLTLGAR
jgi:hypothetical protein